MRRRFGDQVFQHVEGGRRLAAVVEEALAVEPGFLADAHDIDRLHIRMAEADGEEAFVIGGLELGGPAAFMVGCAFDAGADGDAEFADMHRHAFFGESIKRPVDIRALGPEAGRAIGVDAEKAHLQPHGLQRPNIIDPLEGVLIVLLAGTDGPEAGIVGEAQADVGIALAHGGENHFGGIDAEAVVGDLPVGDAAGVALDEGAGVGEGELELDGGDLGAGPGGEIAVDEMKFRADVVRGAPVDVLIEVGIVGLVGLGLEEAPLAAEGDDGVIKDFQEAGEFVGSDGGGFVVGLDVYVRDGEEGKGAAEVEAAGGLGDAVVEVGEGFAGGVGDEEGGVAFAVFFDVGEGDVAGEGVLFDRGHGGAGGSISAEAAEAMTRGL